MKTKIIAALMLGVCALGASGCVSTVMYTHTKNKSTGNPLWKVGAGLVGDVVLGYGLWKVVSPNDNPEGELLGKSASIMSVLGVDGLCIPLAYYFASH